MLGVFDSGVIGNFLAPIAMDLYDIGNDTAAKAFDMIEAKDIIPDVVDVASYSKSCNAPRLSRAMMVTLPRY